MNLIPASPKQIAFALFLLFSATRLPAQKADVTVVFGRPAANFTESAPLGNGRLGAMVFGDTRSERIALNEISLWSGGRQDADNDSAHFYLAPIQHLLLAGKNEEAQALMEKHFIAKGAGSGNGSGANDKYGCYQSLGDLYIKWQDSAENTAHYSRRLDVEHADAIVKFLRGDKLVKEEVFSDFVHDIIWIKLTSSKKGGINVSLSLSRKENAVSRTEGNRLIMSGQLPSGKDKGMQFATVLEAVLQDGKVLPDGNTLVIKDASECWLKIAAATNYDYKTGLLSGENVIGLCEKYIASTRSVSFAQALQKSTQVYQKLFNRCVWKMPENFLADTMTTNQRLIRYFKGGSDPQLPALYFNFGRYLLICSSRPGLLPANLQGLWATEYQTPWNGDYHLDINLQMNYWPAEVTGLSGLAEPLFRFTKDLVPSGRKTARAYYKGEGWVAHVISNPWFYTSPGEAASWGSTLTGGAWLCSHIWEHFRFTKDSIFLKQYYPVLKGAARFLQSILVKEPKHGWLVTAPSNSPENTYIMPNGFAGQTCMGPTMDMQICRQLFRACSQAAAILQTDEAWGKELEKLLPQLAPDQIGAAGDLNEWLDDWKDAEPAHRHVSHLYGLYPDDEITPSKTPELAAACRQTLLQRGDGGTGWSKAWKINFWARLGDGDHAFALLKQLLKPVTGMEINMRDGGGTYPNLFCGHPPFQIDGNFGGTAGIAEMLLQSSGEDEVIRLLPALPGNPDWQEGSIRGLKARGDFEISMRWKNGAITEAGLVSSRGGKCKLLLPANKIIKDAKGKIVAYAGQDKKIVEFNTAPGGRYRML